MFSVRPLAPDEARAHVSALAAVLVDCVAGGASINFMEGFSQEEGEAFYAKAIEEVEAGHKLLWGGFVEGELLGTVMVQLKTTPNQPHRGEVLKMLVHQRARGMGLGKALLAAAEQGAKAAGKTLLVLDTAAGDAAEFMYERCGWTRLGTIPNYALYPDGRPCGATIFYKALEEMA